MATKRTKNPEESEKDRKDKKSPYFRLKPSGVKAGRPRQVLTDEGLKIVENLASIGCTRQEIAVMLACNPLTLKTEENKEIFNSAYARGSANLDISLRRSMVKKAINKDNTQMQIFLAKNRLGMSDNPATVQGEAENDPAWVEEQDVRKSRKESRP